MTRGDGEARDPPDLKPAEVSLSAGKCVVYVPGISALKMACIGGADVGTNVIYRYVDGELTAEPL